MVFEASILLTPLKLAKFYLLLLRLGGHWGIMATAIQKNGMKHLTNGGLNHVDNVNSIDRPSIHPADSKDVMLMEEQEQPEIEEAEMDAPEIDITINNVVCSFSVKCHLDLRKIALEGSNVEYRRENGVSLNSFIN